MNSFSSGNDSVLKLDFAHLLSIPHCSFNHLLRSSTVSKQKNAEMALSTIPVRPRLLLAYPVLCTHVTSTTSTTSLGSHLENDGRLTREPMIPWLQCVYCTLPPPLLQTTRRVSPKDVSAALPSNRKKNVKLPVTMATLISYSQGSNRNRLNQLWF